MAELSGRELDAEVARALFGSKPIVRDGKVCVLFDEDDCPHYSTDPAAVRQVEDEIERRGLQDPYVMHLCAELECEALFEENPHRAVWLLLRATPAERCRAAVRAVHAKEPPAP